MIRVGPDTLAIDLRPLARRYADSMPAGNAIPSDRLIIDTVAGRWRARLAVTTLHGYLVGDSLRIDNWSGWLMVGPR